MAQNKGGSMMTFTPTFFKWLREQLIMIEDYPYYRVDFLKDPEFVLLEGEQWSDEGEMSFWIFLVF